MKRPEPPANGKCRADKDETGSDGHALRRGNQRARTAFRSLTIDSVCRENGCERLGIEPQHMEGIVPLYLGPESFQGRLSRYRLQVPRSTP